ncbi:MAG: hypothetical protein CMN85_13670 [Spongiibacteraceae bacterium]|nr:hypothetical protein [Spongiibacteraceae bacterium]
MTSVNLLDEKRLARVQLVSELQYLLSAEIAGVRTAAYSLGESEEDSLTNYFQNMHSKEAKSCKLLRVAISTLGAEPTWEVGAFFAKATAIAERSDRWRLAERGREVVRTRVEALISEYSQSEIVPFLKEVRELHAAGD